jgi:hypothetical protein
MSLSRRDERALPWGRRDAVMLALLGLVAVFAMRWYWGRAPHPYSDTTMAIYRAFEVDRSIGQQVLYPRLAMDFNFTYGAPLLQYRPPLVHYVIPILHWAGLGWIAAAKATATLELLLAGLGMYVYARWLFGDRRAALVSAAVYLLAPYLLTDIHERGAIGEAAALAVLPWLFWAMHRTLSKSLFDLWPWLSALFIALLMLAHNIIAFLAIPALLLYICLLAWRGRASSETPGMAAALVALALGLGLSAFYWMPALLERNYAQIVSNMLQESPGSQLPPVREWIQRSVVFDYWGPLRYRLSLWQAILAIIVALWVALPARFRSRRATSEIVSKELRFNVALLVGITAGVMLLQLDVSRPLWEIVPLARFIQFPWRLLSIAAFCIALMAGFLPFGTFGLLSTARDLVHRMFRRHRLTGTPAGSPLSEESSRSAQWVGWIVAASLLAVILYASTSMLAPQYNPNVNQLSEDAVSLEGLLERGRSYFTLFDDFLPVGVKVDTESLANPRPAPDADLSPMTDVPTITVTTDRPFRLDLQVHADQPFTLRFHRFFFPGWQVYVAGRPVPTGPSGDSGLVTANLPSGEYPVTVQFGRTPVRSLADIITVVSLFAWIAAGVLIRRARPVLIAMAAALILVAALLLAHHGTGEPPRRPIAYPADFGVEDATGLPTSSSQSPGAVSGEDQKAEVRLLGYHLPDVTWRPGDDLPLHLYWLAPRTPAGNYKVFIHLVTPDDSARPAQSDSTPVLGYSPTTWWEPGEIIVDEHHVHLDESVPPGRYWLLIGMYDAETLQNLPVHGAAKVLPGDRVVLTEIEVRGK